MLIEPASGRSRPATERSTVFLPEPDAPKRIVTPGGATNATSRVNSCESGVLIATDKFDTRLYARGATAHGRRIKAYTRARTRNEKASSASAVSLADR